MTPLDEIRKRLGVTRQFTPKPVRPLIGEHSETRIDGRPELLHNVGEWIVEILILAPTERVARHFDPRAETMLVGIVGGDFFTGFLREHAWKQRKAAFVETSACLFPINC